MHVINSSRDRHLVERFNLYSNISDSVQKWIFQWIVAPIVRKDRELRGKRDLQKLDDRLLRDIGLQRFDVIDQEDNPSSLFKYPSW